MSDAFYTKTWFWLLAVTMVALIVIAVIFEYYGNQVDSWSGIPFWVWLGFAIAIFAFFVSVVLYIIDIRKVTTITYKEVNGANIVTVDNGNKIVYPANYKTQFIDADNKAINKSF